MGGGLLASEPPAISPPFRPRGSDRQREADTTGAGCATTGAGAAAIVVAAMGHVSGPHFRDYHLLLDDQAAQILGVTDAIAERVRKTGNTTLRSIGDISRRQSIPDNDKDFVGPTEMLAELREDNLKLVEQFRIVKDAADEAKDNATSGIVDEWTDQAEERAWFLFEASRGT